MNRRTRTILGGLTLILLVAVPASGAPCVVPDNGSGTVDLPPTGCEYLSPNEVHEIIDGLPSGVTIELAAIHKDFICDPRPGAVQECSEPLPEGECEKEGGSLGGKIECRDTTLELTIGFIGVGLMGHGMAKNIVEKGWPLLVVSHRSRAPVDDLVGRGAREVASPREMAAQADIIHLCVSGSAQVEA